MVPRSSAIASAMLEFLLEDSGAYNLAQGTDPGNVTLDGNFDLFDLARVAIHVMKEQDLKEAFK